MLLHFVGKSYSVYIKKKIIVTLYLKKLFRIVPIVAAYQHILNPDKLGHD